MHGVKTPEWLESMLQYVPRVQRVIQQDHRESRLEPPGQRERLQYPEAVPLDPSRDRKRYRALDKLQRDGTHARNCQIARHSALLVFYWFAQRVSVFEP